MSNVVSAVQCLLFSHDLLTTKTTWLVDMEEGRNCVFALVKGHKCIHVRPSCTPRVIKAVTVAF